MIRSAGRTTEGPRAAVWDANSSMKSSGKSSDHIGRSNVCFNQSGNAFEPADEHPKRSEAQPQNNSVSSAKPNRLSGFRRNNQIPLQQQADFLLARRLGEGTDIAHPDRPVAKALRSNALFRAGGDDLDDHENSAGDNDRKKEQLPLNRRRRSQ